jgi:hypothetical protein
MHARARLIGITLLAAPLLVAGPAAGVAPAAATPSAAAGEPARGATRRAGAGARHADVGGEQECAACHEAATPEAFRAWRDGRHGMALVKCVACHGSTGADFTRRPVAERCRGCHGAQVDSLRRTGARDCFACHAPHTLKADPHGRSAP